MNLNPFNYRHIIWDWNGTLLDDRWLCIESINHLLVDRNLPIMDEARYSKLFRFPVRDYYEAAGFDFSSEPFEVPALEFIRFYDERRKECRLQSHATDMLERFASMGCRQYLLSASETGMLEDMTRHYSISRFFEKICGLDNHYAHSKADLGLELLQSMSVPADSVLMIGDTCHDKEVADLMGITSILCTNGHFPEYRLSSCGASLVRDLEELSMRISGS